MPKANKNTKKVSKFIQPTTKKNLISKDIKIELLCDLNFKQRTKNDNHVS